MRILHVITSLRTGGAEHLMVDLLPALRALGNDVELLVFDGTPTPFMQQLEAPPRPWREPVSPQKHNWALQVHATLRCRPHAQYCMSVLRTNSQDDDFRGSKIGHN